MMIYYIGNVICIHVIYIILYLEVKNENLKQNDFT